MEKIVLMLQLQTSLNEATNGKEWVDGITKNGKTINWKRCVYMECAEMIDSFSWKHWKNIEQKTDWDNLQIEVVDVWHFIMSLWIEFYAKSNSADFVALATIAAKSDSFQKIDKESSFFASQQEIIEKIEIIMFDILDKKSLDIEKLVDDFFDLVYMSGLDLISLYKLYVGKNILNQFRQDHGYKDGTYVKIWSGKEDNAVMKQILEENSSLSPDELYQQLLKFYTPSKSLD